MWTQPRAWEDAEVSVWGGQSPRTVLVSKGSGGLGEQGRGVCTGGCRLRSLAGDFPRVSFTHSFR